MVDCLVWLYLWLYRFVLSVNSYNLSCFHCESYYLLQDGSPSQYISRRSHRNWYFAYENHWFVHCFICYYMIDVTCYYQHNLHVHVVSKNALMDMLIKIWHTSLYVITLFWVDLFPRLKWYFVWFTTFVLPFPCCNDCNDYLGSKCDDQRVEIV